VSDLSTEPTYMLTCELSGFRRVGQDDDVFRLLGCFRVRTVCDPRLRGAEGGEEAKRRKQRDGRPSRFPEIPSP
jgi:hypothetical protein